MANPRRERRGKYENFHSRFHRNLIQWQNINQRFIISYFHFTKTPEVYHAHFSFCLYIHPMLFSASHYLMRTQKQQEKWRKNIAKLEMKSNQLNQDFVRLKDFGSVIKFQWGRINYWKSTMSEHRNSNNRLWWLFNFYGVFRWISDSLDWSEETKNWGGKT